MARAFFTSSGWSAERPRTEEWKFRKAVSSPSSLSVRGLPKGCITAEADDVDVVALSMKGGAGGLSHCVDGGKCPKAAAPPFSVGLPLPKPLPFMRSGA